ncbi:unnamed protein product [Victoria cruziana]
MGELEIEKHVQYILSVEKRKDEFESLVMEHLRMNGAYWGLTALDLLGRLGDVDQEAIISWVLKCQHECGGFAGNIGHDPHILYTLSAVQILALFDRLDVVDIEKKAIKIASNIAGLQQDDGSFSIFCCVGALAIVGAMNHIKKDLLGWWLCERQVKSGGLNGRPEKLPDVCYSWWILSSLTMMNKVHWIEKDRLASFILDCQDKENGGISDRPDDAVDVFHTFFGVSGLSLLEYPGLKAIDPAYALPVPVVNRIFFSN